MQKIKLISQEENNILQNAIYKARQSLSTKNGLDPTEKAVTYFFLSIGLNLVQKTVYCT